MLWRFTWRDRTVVIRKCKRRSRLAHWEEWSREKLFPGEMEDMESSRIRGSYDSPYDELYENVIHTHTPLPWTLLVNHESRCETLKHYKLMFQLDGFESRVYFRPGADVPCLAWFNLRDFKGCADLASAKELVVMSQVYMRLWNEEYIYWMPRVLRPGDYWTNWTKYWFKQITNLNEKWVTGVCPKIEWLYWYNSYRYEVDPWGPRTIVRERGMGFWDRDP